MLRDVRSNVTDGLLGFATATGDGLHIKIGVSPSVTEKPITILGSMGASTIKSKLGLSPLADAVMDAVQGGAARVFCIPVAASTAGTIGEVTKTGDGGGSVTVQGSPNNAYALTVRFTAQGGLNTAAFVYSIDGDNFSDEITVPVTGSYEIEGTGLTIKFTEASSPDQKPSSFLVRDTYTLKTTAPSMTNGDVLGAIEKIKSFSEEFEFVHIVGESTVELWEAVSEAQKELMTVCHKPCFFLMEAAYPADEADGDLSDWALKMEADRKRIKNSDIQVCAAWGRLVRLDGTTQIVNLAGLASGRYAMTKVSVSIGKTKDEDALGFPKTKLLELVPIGYDSTVIELLDVAGYMTFREYDGLDDIFVYHTKMMCKDGSDFRYAEDVRVKNKIIRETRKKALQFKNDDIDLEDIQGELDARAKFISVPLDRMVEDKEISSYETTVDESCYDTFLEDETMSVIIRYEDAKVNIELIIDDTPSQTKYQRYATLRAIFRSPGQSVPQPIPIISEDTAAHGVEKVIFKKLSHKGENKRGQLTATLELWEYIPQTITAKSGSSSGSSSGSGKSGGGAASNLKADYKSYLSNERGKSPARDDADATAAMNKVTAMPYYGDHRRAHYSIPASDRLLTLSKVRRDRVRRVAAYRQ